LKVRFSIGTGIPAKPIKVKKAAKASDKGKKKNPADLFTLVKKKDVMGLEDFLLTATPDEVNQVLPKSGNTILHEALLERAEECVPILLNVRFLNLCSIIPIFEVSSMSRARPLSFA